MNSMKNETLFSGPVLALLKAMTDAVTSAGRIRAARNFMPTASGFRAEATDHSGRVYVITVCEMHHDANHGD